MGYRHVVFEGPRRVAVRPFDLVGEAGPGETLVRTHLSGISSGTELLAYLGKLDPNLPLDETLPNGPERHIPVSLLVRLQRRRRSRGAGRGCGDECLRLSRPRRRVHGSESDLIPIEGLVEIDATLFPLVETALQVSLEVDLEAGDRVVVVGLGVLGLLVSLLLSRARPRGPCDRAPARPSPRRRGAGDPDAGTGGGAAGDRAVDQGPRDLTRGGGERVACGARLDDSHVGARGPCDRRFVVRHRARIAGARRRIPSTPAHAP